MNDAFAPDQLLHLWHEGGCVLVPLLALALFIGYQVAEMLIHFARTDCRDPSAPRWREWIERPEAARGQVGEIIRYTRGGGRSIAAVRERFMAVRSAWLPRLNQRITTLGVAVATAPLLGLLGTVLGMLETFRALGETSGNTLERMSHGIAEALITTEFGLIIAVAGYFGLFLVRRRRDGFRNFLAHLEAVALQHCQPPED